MSKFDSAHAEHLYERSLDGFTDDEIGSVDELGWYGLFEAERTILREDSQGFVYAFEYPSERVTRLNWREICKAYENYDAGVAV